MSDSSATNGHAAPAVLPKQERLLKLLEMTASDNDGEALNATRMANKLLKEYKWTWAMLIAAKIKVVENPFAGTPNPFADKGMMAPQRASAPAQPSGPPPKSRRGGQPSGMQAGRVGGIGASPIPGWTPSPPPGPGPAPPPPAKLSSKANIYGGHCYCCGDYVNAQAGWVFMPKDFNRSAQVPNAKGFAIACNPCNNVGPYGVGYRPAPKQTGQTTTTVPLSSL